MLNTVIELLKSSGADAWEVTDVKKTGWEFYFIRHNLDQNRAVNVEHIHVSVYKKSPDGASIGSASAEIHPTAGKNETAKLIENLIYRAGLVKNPVYELRKPGTEKTEAADKAELTIDLNQISRDFLETMAGIPETTSADLNSYEIFANAVSRRYVNSNGIDHTESYPSGLVEVVTNARNGEHEIELYRLYHCGSCDREGLSQDVSKTLQYGLDRLHTVPTPNVNTIPLVLSTGDSVQLYNYFADRMNTQYVFRGLSDWKKGEAIGKDIQGDTITLFAKQFLPNSSSNYTYDPEGAVIRDLPLIENSVAANYWGNAMFSSYLGAENTFILSNYEVKGGSKSEAEIRTGRYLEVVEFSDFQVEAMTGDIFGEIRLAYLHDGDQVICVTGGSVSGNMRDYMKDMYLSKETVQYNNAVVPAVTKLMNVTVTGAE